MHISNESRALHRVLDSGNEAIDDIYFPTIPELISIMREEKLRLNADCFHCEYTGPVRPNPPIHRIRGFVGTYQRIREFDELADSVLQPRHHNFI